MNNAWGEEVIGLISQMDVVISAVNKATLKVITDYIPGGAGNLWEHAVVLDSNQTWTVPASNTSGKIKVICIGGGNAGQNGYPGEDGQTQSAAEFNTLAQRFGFETVDGYTQATGRIFPAGIGRGGAGRVLLHLGGGRGRTAVAEQGLEPFVMGECVPGEGKVVYR
jgi:hypothetical protein